MTEKQFRQQMHRRLGQTSIGASAIRNQGAAGLIEIMREYFENMNLRHFINCLHDERRYQQFLNHHTVNLLDLFPVNAQSWGAARKGLNLFLRDIVYNRFFCEYFNIPKEFNAFNQYVRHMEVPLDREVGKRIRRDSNKAAPGWPGIKSLQPIVSDLFQLYAGLIAKSEGIATVNIDVIYWREAEEENEQ